MNDEESQKKHDSSKQGRIIDLESLVQLFDDLYLFTDHPKYFKAGIIGSCWSFFDLDKKIRIFVIRIRRNLAEPNFFNTFLSELNHYHLDRLYFKWSDSEIGSKNPSKYAIFVAEMLCHEECWNCRYFGTTSCLRHPKNFIRIFMNEFKDEKTLVENLFKRAMTELILLSDRCPCA